MVRTQTLWTSIDFRWVAKVLGIFATYFAAVMAVPMLLAWWLDGEAFIGGDKSTFNGFAYAALVALVLGLGLTRFGKKTEGEFFRREGILTVGLAWLMIGALGGLPFWFSGWLSPVDSFFESVSGLTTTGSSILGSLETPAISELPRSLLFWRSLSHWLGGLGIVVMFLALLPALGITEKTLFQAEVAGVNKEGLRPRIRHSVVMLMRIYAAITVMLIVGYWLLGMGFFDAVNHSFATIATGGFSTKNASVGEFQNVGIEMLAILGMFMAATNFGLYHRFSSKFAPMFSEGRFRWSKRPKLRDAFSVFWEDREFRFYLMIFSVVVVLLTLTLRFGGDSVASQLPDGRVHDYPASVADSARDSVFAVSSMISSTGFGNCDLLAWPLLAQGLVIFLMLVGGCSGSTGGGIKMARALILVKLIGRNLRHFVRPRQVEPIRIGKDKIDVETADRVVALAVCWILVLIVGTLVLLVLEPKTDLLGAFTSAVTSLCNMGPAFVGGYDYIQDAGIANIGSAGSFGEFADTSKAFMAFVMILGRLEIYTALIIIMPSFWKD